MSAAAYAFARGLTTAAENVPGPVAVFFVSSLLLVQIVLYNGIFLAGVLPSVNLGVVSIAFAPLVNFLWLMAWLSFWRAHCSDPGRIPEEFDEFAIKTGLPAVQSRHEWQPGKATFCKKCQKLRPERAHHCSVCKVCVLRMDHHCPWTANCVGQKNHKYFFLLGVYGLTTFIVSLLTMLPWTIYSLTGFYIFTGESNFDWEYNCLKLKGGLLMLFQVIATGIVCLFGLVVKEHYPNLAGNNTRIEENYDDYPPNPYDQGNSVDNCSEVFGQFGLDWLFPMAPCRPVTDGVSFAKTDEYLPEELEPDEIDFDDKESPPEELWSYRYLCAQDVPDTITRAESFESTTSEFPRKKM